MSSNPPAVDISTRFTAHKRSAEDQRRHALQSSSSPKIPGGDGETKSEGRLSGLPPASPPAADGEPPTPAAPPPAPLDKTTTSPVAISAADQPSSRPQHRKPRTSQPTTKPGDPPPPSQVSRPTPQDKSRTLWLDPSSNSSQPRPSSSSRPTTTARPQSGPSAPPPTATARPSSSQSHSAQISHHDPDVLIKQPETKPISQEQLIAEVKGIYAGLVMVESKCIEVDNAQSSNKDPAAKLNNEQWQALIALHRTLLHEHHDFFLASQHPSASPALRRLASKYAMPARMWRHGIHSFLELLRHRLPAAREHMLTFIYLAYSMMALLYETVPAFEDTWIECLGDLGRYRMAIEDDNMSDREVWTSVSRHWYSKASDKAPSTGRLYHHLAILARPNALQQLYYYTKALCVAVPFVSARESILTLFDPVLNRTNNRLPPQDLNFVYVHAVLFKRVEEKHRDEMHEAMDTFVSGIDVQIARNGRRWLESGMHLGNSNCAAMVGYGDPENPIMAYIKPGKDAGKDDDADVPMRDVSAGDTEAFRIAIELAARTNHAVWSRLGDPSILAHLHVSLVFLYHLTFYPPAFSYVAKSFPWRLLCVQLDTLVPATENTARFESDEFPRPAKGEAPRPLVEDHAMRGLLWTEKYFPTNWFSNDQITDDDKWFEMPSFMDERRTRCLWLAVRIAQQATCIIYDPETRHFSPTAEFDDKKDEETSTTTTYEDTASGAVTPTTTVHSAAGGDPMDIEEDERASKGALPENLP